MYIKGFILVLQNCVPYIDARFILIEYISIEDETLDELLFYMNIWNSWNEMYLVETTFILWPRILFLWLWLLYCGHGLFFVIFVLFRGHELFFL